MAESDQRPHLFVLPMTKDGLCGLCGKSCLDPVHVGVIRPGETITYPPDFEPGKNDD